MKQRDAVQMVSLTVCCALHCEHIAWLCSNHFSQSPTDMAGTDAGGHLATIPAYALCTVVTNSLLPLRLMRALAYHLPIRRHWSINTSILHSSPFLCLRHSQPPLHTPV